MGGLFIWYSEEGTGRGRSPPRPPPSPILAVPNITAHPSVATGQCTNFVLFDVALQLPLESKWSMRSLATDHPLIDVDYQ